MAAIIPRWEWRTFGTHFGVADERFGALQSTGVQESDETYLLGGTTGNAKIRAGLMDIKLLRETHSDLERWEPVMKAAFPISVDDARQVFATLELPSPDLPREQYTEAEFLEAVTGPDGPLRRVDVHKRRVRYTVNGCTSEVTELIANGQPARTIAIESTDQAAVLDRASVHDRAVSDRDVVANRRRVRVLHDVHDGPVLDVRSAADADPVDVAANDDRHPDTALLADFHVADDLRAVVDVGGRMDARHSPAVGTKHAGELYRAGGAGRAGG